MNQLPLFVPDSSWTAPTELPDLRNREVVALDTETRDDSLGAGRGPGWVYKAGHVAGVSAAWREGSSLRSIYVPVRHPDSQCHDRDAVGRWLQDHLASPNIAWVFHNGPYDLGWLRAEWGLKPPAAIHDTTALATMIDENRLSYALDRLARDACLQGKDETLLREAAAAYGWHGDKVKANLWQMPARFVGPYGAADAEQTLQLYEHFVPELEKQDLGAAYQLEMDLIPLIQEMRWRGIRIDTDAAERAKTHCLTKVDTTLRELSDHLGHTVRLENIRSTAWMERACDAQKISYPRTEKTRRGSFTGGKLGWMTRHTHWLPRLAAQIEHYQEAADKFISGFILDYAHRGRLHASINQFRSEAGGTRTHRFSYADPALQQMPARDPELGPMIRGLFLPEEGEVWGALDYSQQEYRLIVHFATVLGLRGAAEAAQRYADDPNTDFHSYVAEITGLDRKPAKDANFAKAYGAGVGQFAAMTGRTKDEAVAIMTQYDREFPFVRELNQRCDSLASRRGYIRMLDGARMHFNRWELAWRDDGVSYEPPMAQELAQAKWPGKRIKRAFTHKAMNGLIQGSAARQTKIAMRDAWRAGIVPLLQMHDELSGSFGDEAVALRLQEIMRDAAPLRVPMAVDMEFGASWGDAKHTWAEAKSQK